MKRGLFFALILHATLTVASTNYTDVLTTRLTYLLTHAWMTEADPYTEFVFEANINLYPLNVVEEAAERFQAVSKQLYRIEAGERGKDIANEKRKQAARWRHKCREADLGLECDQIPDRFKVRRVPSNLRTEPQMMVDDEPDVPHRIIVNEWNNYETTLQLLEFGPCPACINGA